MLDPRQASELLFGQQHIGSHEYFERMLGQSHTVPVEVFPHTQFLRDPDGGRGAFDKYLESSWKYRRPETNTAVERQLHMNRLLDRLAKVERSERNEPPPLAYRRRDGRIVIVDGNHRVAVAVVLSRPVLLYLMSTMQWLRETAMLSSEFFGGGHRGLPYQSVFDGSKELIRGRRADTVDRIASVAAEDLQDKRVMDLGCNIGATTFAATDAGAKSAIGVEYDRDMVVSGLRLNSYFAAPVTFVEHNLNEVCRLSEDVDTIFCFSVAAHLHTQKGLLDTIRSSGAQVMYFEGHAGTDASDYPEVLGGDAVSMVDLVGFNGSGNPESDGLRPMYRCEIGR